MKNKSQAVVLSGGGARGSFQAAAMSNLKSQGILDPDFIYGTSSGALNAIGFSYLGASTNALQWSKITQLSDLFRVNWGSWIWKTGFLDPSPAHKILSDAILNNKPSYPVILTNVNLESGDKLYINSEKVTKEIFLEAAKASVAIPCVVETFNNLVDGAAREIAPLGKAIDDGATELIVVLDRPLDKHAWNSRIIPSKSYFQAIEIGWRYIDLMLHQILLDDIGQAFKGNSKPKKKQIDLKVYYPKDELFDTFAFNKCADGVKYGMDINNIVLASQDLLQLLWGDA